VSFVLKDKSVLSRMAFSKIETILPSGKFIRIHRLFLVAITKISKIEQHQIHINHIMLPIAESYISDLTALAKNQ